MARAASDKAGLAPLPHAGAPLQLRRWSRAEMQARNAVAQKGRDLAWGGDAPWHLTLVPIGDPGALSADTGQWLLRATWAGAAFDLLLTASAIQEWVRGSYPGLDLPELPPEYAVALLEAAGADVLGRLGVLGRGDARLDGAATGPAEGRTLPHAFALRLQAGGPTVLGQLACDSAGLFLLADLLEPLPSGSNGLTTGEIPVLLRIEIGFTWLAAAELTGLAVGDVVLVETVFLAEEGELWLGLGDRGLRATWNEGALTVTTVLTRRGWSMPRNEIAATGDEPLDSLSDLPLRLAFDLGDCHITFGELQSLQVGQSIELPRPLSSAVHLRVNGALVATGELVDIDGRLGVTVHALARTESPPLGRAVRPSDRLGEAAELDEQ